MILLKRWLWPQLLVFIIVRCTIHTLFDITVKTRIPGIVDLNAWKVTKSSICRWPSRTKIIVMVICSKCTHSHTVFNVGRMLVCSTCEKVKNLQKSLSKPVIHNTIDNWIDHRIWHCQPIDGQVKVLNRLTWVNVNKQLTRSAYLNVFPIVNRWIDVVVNKVQVVR